VAPTVAQNQLIREYSRIVSFVQSPNYQNYQNDRPNAQSENSELCRIAPGIKVIAIRFLGGIIRFGD
jgi:hypothetical protein